MKDEVTTNNGNNTSAASTAVAAASLVPSQVKTNTTSKNQRKKNNNRANRKKDSNNNGTKALQQQQQQQQGSHESELNNNNSSSNNNSKKKKGPKKKKNNKTNSGRSPSTTEKKNDDDVEQQKPKQQQQDTAKIKGQSKKKSQGKKNTKKKNVNRKRYPWRRFIPNGTVDPITLETLVSLSYPPFALCADSPYTVVKEWPPKEEEKKEENEDEDRETKVLQEQWGSVATVATSKVNTSTSVPLSQRTLNLYDGRALAYYMVSQLQFIDPLNRRDLTRDELHNLDLYLIRHGFRSDINVVETYDAKGVTMSSAGAAASTESGRAEIRQQMAQALAQSLLSSIFVGGPAVVANNNNNNYNASNTLQQQYAASRQRQNQQQNVRGRNRNTFNTNEDDAGIYGAEEEGLVIIDDDFNPGLRGLRRGTTNHSHAPSSNLTANAATFTPGSLYSASHITSRYMPHEVSQHISNFPALAPASAPAAAAASTSRPSIAATPSARGASRSLARITKVVSKTDPKKVQKQREARELFVKRAAMCNLSFGAKPSDLDATGLLTVPTGESNHPVTEGQLERNKALASALGVTPSTDRQQNFNQGWARPVVVEFGNELNSNYPDSLIQVARENMDLIRKVEKKWKTFLMDDTSASLPLNKMERPCRKMIHEYSDFWKLHTESFDPEPHRYIHCVKLRDTSAPSPLLSVAVRNWRGPRPVVVVDLLDRREQQQQTAGQNPREFPPPPYREPLQLKQPTAMLQRDSAEATTSSMLKPYTESEEQIMINSRSGELFVGRERPTLDLVPRSLPTELPPMEKSYSLREERERQQWKYEEQLQERRKKESMKRHLLESAFASEDEDSIKSHDSADWEGFENLQPVFVESEEEED